MEKIIDTANWERKEHFIFFKKSDYAHYNIGADLDITQYLKKVKEKQYPFTIAMTYTATKVMNEIDSFKYRIRGEQIVLHDKLRPSFSYLSHGNENFKYITVDMDDTMKVFIENAVSIINSQKTSFVMSDFINKDDFIFFSSVPWISFSHISHTISLNSDDSVPRVTWGKYYEKDGRILIPFNVQAHHSFVDGIHMGRYFTNLQNYFDQCGDLE